MNRWRTTLGRLWSGVNWGALLFLWLVILQVFCAKMAPRLGYIFGHRAIGVDSPCITPECDFSAFWPAGLLARRHDFVSLYDPTAFLAFVKQVLTPASGLAPYFYPPPMLIANAPLSHLPFEPAFFVWALAGLALAAALLRWAEFSWPVTLATLLSPAALWNTELGQMGTLGGAVLLAGLGLAARAPARSGLLLGMLTLKPQIGLLVPAALFGARNWRAMAGFAAGCAALLGGSLLWFGPEAWRAYFTLGRPAASAIINAPFNPHAYMGTGVSIFWMARSLGLAVVPAYAAQAVCAVAAMMAAAWLWRGERTFMDKLTLTIMLSLLATPYGYGDDMVAFSAVLAARAERVGGRIGALDVLCWVWPWLCQVVSVHTGILFTPVLVALAFARSLACATRPATGA